MAGESEPGPAEDAAIWAPPDAPPGWVHTATASGGAGSQPQAAASDTGLPTWTVGIPVSSQQVTDGVPPAAGISGTEPSPRRRRIIWLSLAWVGVLLLLAVIVVVLVVILVTLGSSSAHKRAAAQTPTPTTSAPAAQELTIAELQPGDCIQGPSDINTVSILPDVVTVVPCSSQHLAEVFFSAAGYWPSSMAFPGYKRIFHQADAKCRTAFRVYDGIPSSGSQYSYWYRFPLRTNWDSGDRLLVCFAYDWTSQFPGGEPVSWSIKGSDG